MNAAQVLYNQLYFQHVRFEHFDKIDHKTSNVALARQEEWLLSKYLKMFKQLYLNALADIARLMKEDYKVNIESYLTLDVKYYEDEYEKCCTLLKNHRSKIMQASVTEALHHDWLNVDLPYVKENMPVVECLDFSMEDVQSPQLSIKKID